mgnify:CR=1 FL=1
MPKGITVISPTSGQLKELDVDHWSPWSCEPSSFDWSYDGTETCYVLKGKVKVETDDGVAEINAGDLVQFEDGLSCRWIVEEPIRKVFSFDVGPLTPNNTDR